MRKFVQILEGATAGTARPTFVSSDEGLAAAVGLLVAAKFGSRVISVEDLREALAALGKGDVDDTGAIQ